MHQSVGAASPELVRAIQPRHIQLHARHVFLPVGPGRHSPLHGRTAVTRPALVPLTLLADLPTAPSSLQVLGRLMCVAEELNKEQAQIEIRKLIRREQKRCGAAGTGPAPEGRVAALYGRAEQGRWQ